MAAKSQLGDSVVRRAVNAAGGASKVAEKLRIRRISVYEWIYKGRVPSERVLALEAATNGQVSRHEIRPDLYPDESPSSSASTQ